MLETFDEIGYESVEYHVEFDEKSLVRYIIRMVLLPGNMFFFLECTMVYYVITSRDGGGFPIFSGPALLRLAHTGINGLVREYMHACSPPLSRGCFLSSIPARCRVVVVVIVDGDGDGAATLLVSPR